MIVLSPLNTFGVTSLWSEAEVWMGTNASSLMGAVSNSVNGAGYELATNIIVNGNVYLFDGASTAHCDFATMEVELFGLAMSNSCPTQYVAGKAGFTNTLAICGPSGTGSVSYFVEVCAINISQGDGSAAPSDAFTMEHNGQMVSLFPFVVHSSPTASLEAYTSAPQPIIFGVPFTNSANISSCLSFSPLQGFSQYMRDHQYSFGYYVYTVRDSQGVVLSNSMDYTCTSEGGNPYPTGPKLYLGDSADTNLTFYWHSVTNKPYQFQISTNLTAGLWTNVGSSVSGCGGTNCVTIPTTGMSQLFYRLNLP